MDKDLQKAIDNLKQGQFKLVAVKAGQLIYCGLGRGISPLLELYEKKVPGLAGSSIADQVVGNAAALLYLELGVAQVYGELLSSTARIFLESAGIFVKGGRIVPQILSSDRQQLCPMERIAKDCQSAEQFQKKARQFLAEVEESAF